MTGEHRVSVKWGIGIIFGDDHVHLFNDIGGFFSDMRRIRAISGGFNQFPDFFLKHANRIVAFRLHPEAAIKSQP